MRQSELIKDLFGDVLIPPAVFNELSHPSSREDVRRWIESPPSCLMLRQPQSVPPEELLTTLDLGECEALQLALETQPAFILIDERLGRRKAISLGLNVVGALGVLREGYRQGHLTKPLIVIDQMRSVGFRLSDRLYKEFEQNRTDSPNQQSGLDRFDLNRLRRYCFQSTAT